MNKFLIVIFFIFALYLPVTYAGEIIEFKDHAVAEFNPSGNQIFEIRFELKQKARVDVKIFTSDGDLVRVMKGTRQLPSGLHSVTWDGKDDAGIVVPDEAFIPVLVLQTKDNQTFVADPRQYGGGEVINSLDVSITREKHIKYFLPQPARVLIRTGIKNGPMLRSLANWAPKTAGRNIQQWDGFDSDGLIDLKKNEHLSVLVTAFKLPPNAIITCGNKGLNYRQYREIKKWKDPIPNLKKVSLVRGQNRISRHYYYARTKDIDPEVSLQISGDIQYTKKNIPVFKDRVNIKVDLAQKDKWALKETLYEIGFYVDNEFISEEEQGYVPLTWIWKPNGLSPGRHTLTVNVSGFRGQVGVKSIIFVVE